MSIDLQSRKAKTIKNYMIEVKAKRDIASVVKTNSKSNLMLAKKFKSDFEKARKSVL